MTSEDMPPLMQADQEFPLKSFQKSSSGTPTCPPPRGILEKSATLRPCIGLRIFAGKSLKGDWDYPIPFLDQKL
jgi:hypothetical protein